MVVVSGSTNLSQEEDRPSASPFLPKPARKVGPEGLKPGEPVPLTVLLLEDNETDEFVIREVLEQSGHVFRVDVARDGHDAVEYLRKVEDDEEMPCPALILLDLNVPKISGSEVLRQVRRSSRCSRTPVIVVSSSDSESDRAAAQSLGVQAYFRKPANLKAYLDLIDVIKQVLGGIR